MTSACDIRSIPEDDVPGSALRLGSALGGAFSALVTPLRDDRPDEAVLRALIDYQLDHGLAGFFIGGGTGQGILLDPDERRRVAEVVVEQNRGRGAVIVHAGAPATRTVVDLVRHAAAIGADAVAALPPFYYRVDRDALLEHYRAIARASDLPVLMYHIPALTGVQITAETARELRGVGRFVGLKYSDYDLYHMQNLIKACDGDLIALSGNDEVFFPALAMGARGSIGVTQNCLPWLFSELYECFQAGDYVRARQLQDLANRVIVVLDAYPLHAAIHEALTMLGFPCGPPRLPLRDLTDAERRRFRTEIEMAGLFALQSATTTDTAARETGVGAPNRS